MATGCRGRVVLGLILALWHAATGAASPQTPLCKEGASECSERDATRLLHRGKAVEAALGPPQPDKSATCEWATDDPAKECGFKKIRGPTSVYLPAGEKYKCFLDDTDLKSPGYNFGVIPGKDRDTKLLLYFSPGGACFKSNGIVSVDPAKKNQPTCVPFPDSNPDVADNEGFILSDDAKNPFRDFTKVHLKYCSGDLFLGNSKHFWTNFPDGRGDGGTITVPVHHKGYNQARAVLDWVKANFASVTELAVAGSSSGSLGAQFWTSTIFKEVKFTKGYTVYDSYVGIFPPFTESNLIKHWYEGCHLPLDDGTGECSSGSTCALPLLLSDDPKNACKDGTLSPESFLLEALHDLALKEVFFSHLQTKYDKTQREFYGLINTYLWRQRFPLLSEEAFYYQINEVLKRYAKAGAERYAVRMLEPLANSTGGLDDHIFATTERWFNHTIADFVGDVLERSATSVCVGDDVCQQNKCGKDCQLNVWECGAGCTKEFCDKDLFGCSR